MLFIRAENIRKISAKSSNRGEKEREKGKDLDLDLGNMRRNG